MWWDGALWFVDIEGRALHRFEPDEAQHDVHETPGRIGFAVPSRAHGWLVAQDASLAGFRPGGGPPRILGPVEEPVAGTRLNDGKSDPTGRLYAGTMHLALEPGKGALYRFGNDLRPERVVETVSISNGLAWHELTGSMYYIDSPTGRIDRFDWCPETGEISGRRPVATLENGTPDGMCIDRDGKLWVGMWGGSRVACVDPEAGHEVASIGLPCPNVTSCCFGGAALDRLWITTARVGMNDEALAAHPEAGGVFVADPGTVGLAATPVA